ncbi:hypothetical protein UNSWDHB_196 [Dehalobacter sp. UNSWDHB]|jgi:Uncharacterized conserved protein|uniref:DUF192 domain-containing protein n=1 Tax=unclassified Dehalobacter TaxID=2635733 RepID=UPI00028B2711|nr:MULTISPECIES: DUF192 domain-containing protein [unclassified Dehalobacter]AFV01327.1 protein of unknown function DUF192 [Dehalobacter sp. DCA]AFV04367.1 protein of unknown function DUF192 [Dehalobacter sp. CF]EQB22477.1 hypothetical protein UNSWDHB_196 [Dehalobacter sp. UNSWDHB]
MKELTVFNQRIQKNLGTVLLADTFFTRLRGLLGTRQLDDFHGMLINPCNQVHMIGMRYPLSVWFVSKDLKIVKIIDNLSPKKVSPCIKDAAFVLEFPHNWADFTGSMEGDKLEIQF